MLSPSVRVSNFRLNAEKYKNNRHITCVEVAVLVLNTSLKTDFFPVGEVWNFDIFYLNYSDSEKTRITKAQWIIETYHCLQAREDALSGFLEDALRGEVFECTSGHEFFVHIGIIGAKLECDFAHARDLDTVIAIRVCH